MEHALKIKLDNPVEATFFLLILTWLGQMCHFTYSYLIGPKKSDKANTHSIWKTKTSYGWYITVIHFSVFAVCLPEYKQRVYKIEMCYGFGERNVYISAYIWEKSCKKKIDSLYHYFTHNVHNFPAFWVDRLNTQVVVLVACIPNKNIVYFTSQTFRCIAFLFL